MSSIESTKNRPDPLDFFRQSFSFASRQNIKNFGSHWRALASENLSRDDWVFVMRAIINTSAIDNKAYRRAVVCDAPTHRVLMEAVRGVTDPSDMLCALEFFRMFRKQVPFGLFADFHDRIFHVFEKYEPHEQDRILKLFRKVQLRPVSAFLDKIFKRFLDGAAFDTPARIVDQISVFADYGLTLPEKVIFAINSCVSDICENLSIDDYNNLLTSLVVLDAAQDPSCFKQLLWQVYDPDSVKNMSVKRKVNSWLGLPYDSFYIDHHETKSHTEIRLAELFNRAGGTISSRENHVLPGMVSYSDIVCEYDGKSIVIEADGPFHFYFEPDGMRYYDGATILSSSLKNRTASSRVIVHIDYESSRCMFEKYSRSAVNTARSILDQAADAPQGSYAALISPSHDRTKLIPLTTPRQAYIAPFIK